QVNEEPRALHVAQKANAESSTFVRALDQAGQIGYNESATDVVAFFSGTAAGGLRHAVGADDAEIWLERSERIICDFWARSGNDGDQRGLSSIRVADQTHIGK